MKVILDSKEPRIIIRFSNIDTGVNIVIQQSMLKQAQPSIKGDMTKVECISGRVFELPIPINRFVEVIDWALSQAKANSHPINYHIVTIEKNDICKHQLAEVGLDKDFRWDVTDDNGNVIQSIMYNASKMLSPEQERDCFIQWLVFHITKLEKINNINAH